MYYMLDPFRNRNNMNERLLTRTKANTSSKNSGSNTASIFDILVLGALCNGCGQPVCIGEVGKYFKNIQFFCYERPHMNFN